MFFILRCAFWLMIVFHAMSWPQTPAVQEASPPPGASRLASEIVNSLGTAAGAAVASKLEEGCSKAPAECLALAARLPQIVAMTHASGSFSPKWPLRLAESETSSKLFNGHKPLPQPN